MTDSAAIETYAKVRALLEEQGQRIDTIDCLIGCTAIVYGLTVITHNSKHFDRIPGIRVQDWQID